MRDALERGALRPGGRIVEGIVGNTDIGLALVGNSIGCQSAIIIPETHSEEKKQTLRMLGADLAQVLAVPYKYPNNIQHDEIAGARHVPGRDRRHVLKHRMCDRAVFTTGTYWSCSSRKGGHPPGGHC